MIYLFSSREELHSFWEEHPEKVGPSPGGAAGALGMSRQAMHAAIKRDLVDLIRLQVPGEPGPYLYVPWDSVQAYRDGHRNPDGRGPRSGWRGRLVHNLDKYATGCWDG